MRIAWDNSGERTYTLGVEKGVLYKKSSSGYTIGVPWNGLSSVTESPSGADKQKFYADNMLYGSIRGAEDFGGTIECYTYPDEFAECNGEIEIIPGVRGNQQGRKVFGLSYVNKIGNDEDGMEHGEEIHLIYGATCSPSEKQHKTVNDSPSPDTMSFSFACTPVKVAFADKPLSHIIINSNKIAPEKLTALKNIIYGSDAEGGSEPRLPLPDELKTLLLAVPAPTQEEP